MSPNRIALKAAGLLTPAIALMLAALATGEAAAQTPSTRYCATQRALGRYPPGCPRPPRPQPPATRPMPAPAPPARRIPLHPFTLTDDQLNQLCRPEIEAYLPILIRDMEDFARRARNEAEARTFREAAQEVRDRGISYIRFASSVGSNSVVPRSPESLAATAREVARGRGLPRTPDREMVRCFWNQILAHLEGRPLRDGSRR